MKSSETRLLAAHSLLLDSSENLNLAPHFSIDDIVGTSANNTLTGTDNADTFDISQGGGDTVKAKGGNDIINAGAQFSITDKIDGGSGSDTVNLNGTYNMVLSGPMLTSVENLVLQGNHFYSLTTADSAVAAGTTLNVNAGGASMLHFDGSTETDGILNITGSAGNDMIFGGAGADTIGLYTGGNDIAFGGGGDDIFVFTPGSLTDNDYIDGGSDDNATGHRDMVVLTGDFSAGVTVGETVFNGIEVLYFAPNPSFSYHVTLSDGNIAAGANLTVFAGDLTATESAYIDDSAETDGAFLFTGGAGNDTVILGSEGSAIGGMGNDTFIAPTNDFNALGFDADYLGYFDRTNSGVGVTVNLTKVGVVQNTIGAGKDTITGFGNLFGSQYADTLTGDGHNNFMVANGGNDLVNGAAGDDFIEVGPGTSDIRGSSGIDFAGFDGFVSTAAGYVAHATMGATVSLLQQGHVQNFGEGSVTLTGIENLSGSVFADNFTGDINDNEIYGGDGNDVLHGDAGNDTLYGDAAFVPGTSTVDEPKGFIYTYVGNDTLDGGVGNDIIYTGGGTDIVTGGTGNDTINMEAGFAASDSVDGGTGTDTVNLDGDYSTGVVFSTTTMVNVESIVLAAGNSYMLTIVNATVVAKATLVVDGSALGATDTLTFNGVAELDGRLNITGGAGDDSLTGGKFLDVLTGGGGADELAGGAAADTFVYAGAGDSTSTHFDTITAVDFAQDKFSVGFIPTGINTRVTVGSLSYASFDTNLASVIDSTKLSAHQAVLFTANGGDESGHTFLIVDMNGNAGYQASQDLVIEAVGALHVTSLTTGTFV